MDEATLFDFFFAYLQKIEVFLFLHKLDPHKQKIKNVSSIQLVPVLLMKWVGFSKMMDETSNLLLTYELLMSIAAIPD